MRILVCDDDKDGAAERIDRISRCSEANGDDEVVIARHALTARESLRLVATTKFDLVLIDLCLPIRFTNERRAPESGPWLARAIRRAKPQLTAPLVMWTSNIATTLDARNQCRAFLHHGGHHVIDKVDSAESQLLTLEAALAGEMWQPESDGLTDTEREILAYYAAGRSIDGIASAIFRGSSTVETHIKSIRNKLLGVTPPGTARGFGPLLAAATATSSRVSWLPVEHLSEPVGVFAGIDKG